MTNLRLPNFFIVGAPKAGTTSLYIWLKQHPQIWMPKIKEPDYFAPHARRMDWRAYLALFRGAKEERAIGEASTSYFGSAEAPGLIHEKFPSARIIILLRNPVDQAYSFFRYARMVGRVRHETFESALEHDDRFDLESLDGRERMYHQVVGYVRRGMYFNPVKRYLNRFGKSHVKVHLFEEMIRDPRRIYVDLCRFLGVSTDFLPVFTAENSSRPPRWATLQWILGRLAPRVPLSKIPFGLVRRANLFLGPRKEAMEHKIRLRLLGTFRPEIDRLSDLLDRDLSIWSGPGEFT